MAPNSDSATPTDAGSFGQSMFIAEVLAAWADLDVFNNGRWTFGTDAERTIHYIAGGSFIATGDGFEVEQG